MFAEKIIETRQCKKCGSSFNITDRDMEFYDKISPVFAGKKYLFSLPSFCPNCRQQRRLSFRNERKLYRRKCDLTGKEMITLYSPDKPYTVYDQKVRWDGDRSPTDYGRDFDSGRPFSDQLDELLMEVPHISTGLTNPQNCDYTNYSVNCKNCYLSRRLGDSEDIYYSYLVLNSKDCIDCYYITLCENNYELIDCESCSNSRFSQNCSKCYDVAFCYACNGCNSCFGCVSLQNQKHCFFNTQLSEEEYKKAIEEMNDIEAIKVKFKQHKIKFPHRENMNARSENVVGNILTNCKNVFYGFDCDNVEDGKYICGDVDKDVMDGDFIFHGERVLDQLSTSHANTTSFCYVTNDSSNVLYSFYTVNSHNIFGCAFMKDKEYCILNKQYTKAEYEKLVPQIIEHMKKTGERGEFLSPSISAFGYNETVAMEYYPLSKEEALKQGFKRSDYESPTPKVEKTVRADEIANIREISDDILNQAIICEVTGKPFRIIKPELEFYRRHGLPLPKRHPDQRHFDHVAMRNPRKLRDRKCMKCGIDIKTSYSPERPEIVYCEKCYDHEVYG